jgi:predicted 3-demethylubiquinone-9 3-methyltransferase (glyoxalase superfamily)
MSTTGIGVCLWFDDQAEEAARFYTGIFKDSRLGRVLRYGEAGREVHGQAPGTVMTVDFELNGQQFIALNGGPVFTINEAVSLQIECDTQDEIDYYWSRLTEGGDPSAQQCGWLKDKFGVSWQVTPKRLSEMLADPDREKAQRAMVSMLDMKKFDLAELERAFAG